MYLIKRTLFTGRKNFQQRKILLPSLSHMASLNSSSNKPSDKTSHAYSFAASSFTAFFFLLPFPPFLLWDFPLILSSVLQSVTSTNLSTNLPVAKRNTFFLLSDYNLSDTFWKQLFIRWLIIEGLHAKHRHGCSHCVLLPHTQSPRAWSTAFVGLVTTFLQSRRLCSWNKVPWFFAELYLYIRFQIACWKYKNFKECWYK